GHNYTDEVPIEHPHLCSFIPSFRPPFSLDSFCLWTQVAPTFVVHAPFFVLIKLFLRIDVLFVHIDAPTSNHVQTKIIHCLPLWSPLSNRCCASPTCPHMIAIQDKACCYLDIQGRRPRPILRNIQESITQTLLLVA